MWTTSRASVRRQCDGQQREHHGRPPRRQRRARIPHLGLAAAAAAGRRCGRSVAINYVNVTTTASAGSGAHLTATSGNVVVRADEVTGSQTVAGAAGVSTEGSGVGAAVGVNIVDITTSASIGTNAVIIASGDVNVTADAALIPVTVDLPDPLGSIDLTNVAISGGIADGDLASRFGGGLSSISKPTPSSTMARR
jgi:hypothetical protein